MNRTTIVSALVLLTAACVPEGEGTNAIPDLSHTDPRCAPAALDGWIGRDVGLLDPAPGEDIRILTPGSVVSSDYRQNRLTLYLDANGTVQRAECG